MSARVIPMADDAFLVSCARQVLRHSDDHEEADLRASCAVLLHDGDWIDRDRAAQLVRRLDAGVARQEAPALMDAVADAEEDRLWAETVAHARAGGRGDGWWDDAPRPWREVLADVVGAASLFIALAGVLVLGWGLS